MKRMPNGSYFLTRYEDLIAVYKNPKSFSSDKKTEFAAGIHARAGMNLARLEGKIAISHFLSRFPNYELTGEPVRGGRARFRGFLRVPARVIT